LRCLKGGAFFFFDEKETKNQGKTTILAFVLKQKKQKFKVFLNLNLVYYFLFP